MNANKTIWLRVRQAVYTLQLIAGLGTTIFQPSNSTINAEIFDFPIIIVIPIGILFFTAIPFMTAAVIAFQSINPFTAPTWHIPTHRTNPFQMRDPLHFFHFAGHTILSYGAGVVLASTFIHFRSLADGVFIVACSYCTLAGVRLAMKWCRHKLQST